MAERFKDKVIVITGGGSGLGRECALQWSAEGASVVVTDVREDRAVAVAKEIEDLDHPAVGIRADMRVEEDVERAVQEALDRFGRIDIMFANAGCKSPRNSPLEDVTLDEWDDMNNVVYRGVFLAGKYACRAMKEQGGGNIVVTTSAAGLNAYPISFTPYGSGKAGAIGLVKYMAVEWGKHGIRVNGLAPTHGMSINFAMPPDAPVLGVSYEEFAFETSGEAWQPYMFVGPLKVDRPPGLQDNAAVATFLASDDSKYMSGIVIPSCDGGNFALTSIPFPEGWSLAEMVEQAMAKRDDAP